MEAQPLGWDSHIQPGKSMLNRSVHSLFFDLISGEAKGPVASFARAGLSFLSKPYLMLVLLRRFLYSCGVFRQYRIDVPVISVGNITLGGSGKTPFAEWLAKWFKSRGLKPAIVSRGYGKPRRTPRTKPLSNIKELRDDEQIMLSQRLPWLLHLTDKDRVTAAARAASENHANVIILDDAFQHLRLHRDLDILVIDCLNPFGYGHLFPRGLMREPQSAIRRAHLVCLSHTDVVSPLVVRAIEQHIRALAPEVAIIHSRHRALHFTDPRDENRLTLEEMEGKRVLSFCGIGNPLSFELTLAQTGLIIVRSERFPDHYYYTEDDLSSLSQLAALSSAEALITTEKDLVRIPFTTALELPILGLAIRLEITAGLETLEGFLSGSIKNR